VCCLLFRLYSIIIVPLIWQAKHHLEPSLATQNTPLSLTILHPIANHSLSFIKAQQLAESTKIANQVEKLHKKVSEKVPR
jgi:hypothetical protein